MPEIKPPKIIKTETWKANVDWDSIIKPPTSTPIYAIISVAMVLILAASLIYDITQVIKLDKEIESISNSLILKNDAGDEFPLQDVVVENANMTRQIVEYLQTTATTTKQ